MDQRTSPVKPPLFEKLPEAPTGCPMKRRPHAVLDVHSRRWKAIKIDRLLGLCERPKPLKLLEIGTGSGIIAHYFATHPKLPCIVTAVDIVDQRVVKEGFEFCLVSDTSLPFPAGSFDAVISNHVIEHLGGPRDQESHLREMRRIMGRESAGYLATPNRWALIEPHYKLPFLSWLPRSKRDRYLRLARAGEHYDCEPLSVGVLERLLKKAGFHFQNIGAAALQEMLRLETQNGSIARLAGRVPPGVWHVLQPVMPTLVYRLNPGP